MWGWLRRAAMAISRRKRSGPSAEARSGRQDLDGDPARVLAIPGQVDRTHPASAELALDRVAASERRSHTGKGIRQGAIPRSGMVEKMCGDDCCSQSPA